MVSKFREREIPYDFIHVALKKQQLSKEKKKGRDKPRNRLLTAENKQMVPREEVSGGRGERGDGDEGVPLS